jgi:diaminopimelate decarboxylase
MPAHLRFAAAAGVTLTTFDTAHELQKIATLHPETGRMCFPSHH